MLLNRLEISASNVLPWVPEVVSLGIGLEYRYQFSFFVRAHRCRDACKAYVIFARAVVDLPKSGFC